MENINKKIKILNESFYLLKKIDNYNNDKLYYNALENIIRKICLVVYETAKENLYHLLIRPPVFNRWILKVLQLTFCSFQYILSKLL